MSPFSLIESSYPLSAPLPSSEALHGKLQKFAQLVNGGKSEEARLTEASLFSELRPVALHVARRFRHVAVSDEDIRQEAFLGLIHAVRHYPSTEVTKPVSYLSRVIERRLIHFINTHSRTVRRPASWYRRRSRIRAAECVLESEGIPATVTAVAGNIGIDPDLLRRWKSLDGNDVSIFAPIGNGDGENTGQVLDLIEDEDASPVQEELEQAERFSGIRRALDELSPRDRELVELRFGESCGLTLDAIGVRFGVSRERVRQLEERALKRLRERMGPT